VVLVLGAVAIVAVVVGLLVGAGMTRMVSGQRAALPIFNAGVIRRLLG
jgi:hypothetical protein